MWTITFLVFFPENKRVCITFPSSPKKSPLLLGGDCWWLWSFLFWLLSDRLFIATARFEEMSVYEDFPKTPFVNNSTADLLPGRNRKERCRSFICLEHREVTEMQEKKNQFGSRNYLEPPALFGYDRRDKAAQKGKNKSVSKSTTPLWGRKQKQ